MGLFHFTSRLHLPHIVEAGHLRPTESNVGAPFPTRGGPSGSHVGPNVVWLTDQAEISDPNPQYLGLSLMKREVRFEVDVRAIRWLDWAPARAMDPDWRRTFIQTAGGEEVAERWYVWPSAIRSSRWVEVIDTETGQSLLTPSGVAT